MLQVTGKSPASPFFALCDQFIFERVVKINHLVQELNRKGFHSQLPKKETLSHTCHLRGFFSDRLVEHLSDSFICKFALLKLFSNSKTPQLFLEPFFHDKSLVAKKGLSRFKTYDKDFDLAPHFLCHRGLEAKLSPLLEDIKMAQKLYAKLALTSLPDLHLLSYSALELEASIVTLRTSITQKQIQDMILFLMLQNDNAVKQGHLVIKIPYTEKLIAIAESTSEFGFLGFEEVESTLITFLLYTLKQQALFKSKLISSLEGSYSYDAYCTEYGLTKVSDMTKEHFQSMLNQFVHHTSYLFESTRDILCHMQPLLVHKFCDAAITHRFEFSQTVHQALLTHLKEVSDILSSLDFLKAPEDLKGYLAPFEDDLAHIETFFTQFLAYYEYSSLFSLFNGYKIFITKLDPLNLNHVDVFNFFMLKEQLEQMLAIFQTRINGLSSFISKMHDFIKKTPIEEKDKDLLRVFAGTLFGNLSIFSLSLSVINKLSLSLFRDTLFERKPFDIVFEISPFEGDISKDIVSLAPKPLPPLEEKKEAAVEAASVEEVKVASEPLTPLPKDLSSRKVEAILRGHGFELVRTRGSHFFYRHSELKKTVTLPAGYDSIAIGTLRSIFEQAGLR
jgi:predicted RNA binding protein YcfA (HicA-like mRNA interferase family)